jgi:glycosyltransferase involved in cell wall biosynthesis
MRNRTKRDQILKNKNIAILIPCFNEEQTIGSVITGFRQSLPKAHIVVCDNNSDDNTKNVALELGVTVLSQPLQGKGYAIEHMFRVVDADFYVLVDGDSTYDPKVAEAAVQKCTTESLDMLVGVRTSADGHETYLPLRSFGNTLFTIALRVLFSSKLNDVLSGYRVFSRRFVKSMPILSGGFGIETEMNIHALSLSFAIGEFETQYFERPLGSVSKLGTFKDGAVIFMTILRMLFEHKPLAILGFAAVALGLTGGLLFFPIIQTYFETGLVPRLPTTILSLSLIILSFFSFFSGLILDSISRQRIEAKKLLLLNVSV